MNKCRYIGIKIDEQGNQKKVYELIKKCLRNVESYVKKVVGLYKSQIWLVLS